MAEAIAAGFLRLKGYRILARRYRVPVGEIDIVARRGGVVAFVEVKARADLAIAAESVGARQRRRIGRAAEYFVQSHPEATAATLRFDVVRIGRWRAPRHLVDAWRIEGRGTTI